MLQNILNKVNKESDSIVNGDNVVAIELLKRDFPNFNRGGLLEEVVNTERCVIGYRGTGDTEYIECMKGTDSLKDVIRGLSPITVEDLEVGNLLIKGYERLEDRKIITVEVTLKGTEISNIVSNGDRLRLPYKVKIEYDYIIYRYKNIGVCNKCLEVVDIDSVESTKLCECGNTLIRKNKKEFIDRREIEGC